MKPLPKRTRLAISLIAQAHGLDVFGSVGLDTGKLSQLLKDAALSLDSTVKPLERRK